MALQPFLAREHGPHTSGQAADAAVDTGLVDKHEDMILAVLRFMPHGGTSTEIAEAISSRFRVHVDRHQVARRFAAMLGREQIFRRTDPDTEKPRTRRGATMNEIVHYLSPGDFPLGGE